MNEKSFQLSTAWNAIISKVNLLESDSATGITSRRDLASSETCFLSESVQISYFSRTFEIRNVQEMSLTCLTRVVQNAAVLTTVLRVMIGSAPEVQNYEARSFVQTGAYSSATANGISDSALLLQQEPYTSSGLTGKGQVVAIADTGLNDLSCFFLDDSGAYSTAVTDRTGKVESKRRKVVQYVSTSTSDGLDDMGGHGTHVSGSAAGSCPGSQGRMNGMAPDAKIAFFDVGTSPVGRLDLVCAFRFIHQAIERMPFRAC